MKYQDLLDDLKNPEKETTELKSSFSDKNSIGKTIAAFSTKSGGRLWIGIDKNGIPIGTQCSDDIKTELQNLARTIQPPAIVSVDLISHDAKKGLYIVYISVQKGSGIYCYKGIPYERRGDTNHSLTPDEVFDIQKDRKKIYFDGMQSICDERPALISDIDERKIERFYEMAKKEKIEGMNITRFLLNHNTTFAVFILKEQSYAL